MSLNRTPFPAHMPARTRRLSKEHRREIRDRLKQFVDDHYVTRSAMEQDTGVAHSTAAAWFNPDPVTPDSVTIVELAKKKRLNPSWLLMGKEPVLLDVDPRASVWVQLRQALIAEVMSQTRGSRAEVERVVPTEHDLFHGLVADALTEWLYVRGKESSSEGRGVSAAIRKLLIESDDRRPASRAFISFRPSVAAVLRRGKARKR
jgi:hypothetical protein